MIKLIGEQIKALRKFFGLNQTEFGAKIGLKTSSIATYESGRNDPIETVLLSICREYGCDESWLRTGEGEMFPPRTEEEELSALFASMLTNPDAAVEKKVVSALPKLPPEAWIAFREFVKELTGKQEKRPV